MAIISVWRMAVLSGAGSSLLIKFEEPLEHADAKIFAIKKKPISKRLIIKPSLKIIADLRNWTVPLAAGHATGSSMRGPTFIGCSHFAA
tara:strand:- start:249 stop:515 length:267 start_codon:yes stop_codon:yes gene_type:complete